MCETTNSDSFKHLEHTGSSEYKENQMPLPLGPPFLSHDKCCQDATFDYSSFFFKLRPNSSKSYLPLLSSLDRSNFLVLIKRFLHWYNLLNSRHIGTRCVPAFSGTLGLICAAELTEKREDFVLGLVFVLVRYLICEGIFVEKHSVYLQM